ncbi:aminotransferase class I/II-fold pyridoxal phosphate-dependent enzyme [Dissulfurirhabdus thermomarina]|uniref:Aminotransferase class I/II-fold pyridoxal phosphate-dependent enzyme n=1 Tax=Dissulfurirhabdus thermomarina TaxID=1765737 RepID=A0A6N9TR68_DISTH|nr:aminotransferase class I/II-fold pyridoxal phosphate-dependent enzyme [Dissulfurirhabdus thermomarina]NDY42940.1 aminotransferase class I/II-fold pyridoxal phosphate-dependent enzyme [Dissulfurirhabdus thermomarina]NMX22897.1 aminotransferase class I/II-fold pyridoxal phosphate-dependent enzyme [Dissulfurirhabdus thermomarina]
MTPTDRPVRETFLPFSRPTIGQAEIDEVVDSLRSGWITTGPKVAALEKAFSDWSGGREAVAVNSATAGLHILLCTLDLAPGDEVITTPITWPSTVNNIEILGARPVFADVDRETLQIDPAEVERRLSPRTRAVIPVHFAGAPADLDALRALCEPRGIPVLEDAAHAVGTRYKGRLVGAEGEAAVFSFHPIKNMTTGEGGMVLCADPERAARMRRLRFHGISRDAWRRYAKGGVPQYEVEEPGFKYNMLDIQAAIGLHQFARLEEFNRRRAELAARYHELLAGIPEVRPLGGVPYPHVHAWHLYVVRLELEALAVDRDRFIAELQAENIGIGLHFPAVHLQKYYRERYGFRPGDLPRAEWNGERLFSLPLYPLLEEADQADVAAALERLVRRFRR